jgi:hypothetical protein
MLFCVLTEAQVEKLNRLYDVSYWDIENKVVRLATTFSTRISRLEYTLLVSQKVGST